MTTLMDKSRYDENDYMVSTNLRFCDTGRFCFAKFSACRTAILFR